MFIPPENLRVLIQAKQVGDTVWPLVKLWSQFEKRTMGEQLIRSIDSIGANIAEGYGRHSVPDYCIARGSLEESEFWIDRCEQRFLLSADTCTDILAKLNKVSYQLNAFISAEKRRTIKPANNNHPIIQSSNHRRRHD